MVRSGLFPGSGLVRGVFRDWSRLARGLGEFLQAFLLLLLLMFLLLGQLALAFLERIVGLGQKTLLDRPATARATEGSLRGFPAACLGHFPTKAGRVDAHQRNALHG